MKKTIVEIVKEVINYKLDIAEKVIEEKIKPMLDIAAMGHVLRKPYYEWTQEQIQLAIQLYGEEAVRTRMAHDMNKKITTAEEELEIMEGKTNG